MKITDHIAIVASGASGFSLTNAYDCTVYLVDGGDDLALIDAGVGVQPERIIHEIRKCGYDEKKISRILLTHGHGDHAGGAAVLAELCDATVYAMEPAADFIRKGDIAALSLVPAIQAGVYEENYQFRSCDVIGLAAGDKVSIGNVTLTVVESEGHSAGHCCYFGEIDQDMVLFAGDSIQCDGKIALQAIWDCDLQKYVDTVYRLGKLCPKIMLPAHGRFALEDGWKHIDKAVKVLETLALPKNSIGE